MTWLGGVLPHAAGRLRRSRRQSEPEGEPTPADTAGPTSQEKLPLVVETIEGVRLIRNPEGAAATDQVAEAGRAMPAEQGTTTVVVGVEGDATPELWTLLAEVLDSLHDSGTSTVRLVMSGAGADRPGGVPVAQRIADGWELEVVAPEGDVVMVPGGSLFVLGPADSGAGWRRFAPGAEPRSLGPRSPAPAWQAAIGQLPGRTRGGCVVEQVPAGVLVRPARARSPQPGDLAYAVPAHDRGPTMLVGTPGDNSGVPSDDLAALLTALPAPVRATVRLAPGKASDLLPVAQDVADLLGAEVELLTGPALFTREGVKEPGTVTGAAADVAASAANRQTAAARPVLLDADGAPTWRPFVEAVACQPAPDPDGAPAPAPRLLRWHPPIPGYGNAKEGVVHLSDHSQVSVTRAGLAVGPRGRRPPLAGRPVDAGRVAIEVGERGQPLEEPLISDLSRLLFDLDVDVREHTTLYVHGVALDGGRRMRRLAVRHGVALVEPLPVKGQPLPAVTTERPPSAVTPVLPEPGPHTPAEPGPRPPAEPAEPETPPVPSPSRPMTTGSDGPSGPSGAAASPSVPVEPAAPESRPESSAASGRAASATPAPAGDPLLGDSFTSDPLTRAPQAPDGDGSSTRLRDTASAPTPSAAATSQADEAASEHPTDPAEEPLRDPDPVGPDPDPEYEPEPESGRGDPPSPPNSEPSSPGPAPEAETTPLIPAPEGASLSADSTPLNGQISVPAQVAVPVPFPSTHRSTDAERAAFRALAGSEWDHHDASVARALTRMPVLRGLAEQEFARVDLVAVHAYLTAGSGPLYHEDLVRALRNDDDTLHPYIACLVSGLRKLSSYRGVVLRGGSVSAGLEGLTPGMVLRDPAPISAVPLGVSPVPAGDVRYAILSSTGRRASSLLGTGSRSGVPDEVIFPPGTGFRVLRLRMGDTGPLILLRELPATVRGVPSLTGAMDDRDRSAPTQMERALDTYASELRADHTWSERCAGPIAGDTALAP
ncbi:hypothetical protein [Streptomyces sp. NPDC098781]|uniref:hypothetical protein n=1 Tax=Streptomyces sp. NPDC098781 TaxID=3366097 RepID=UPI00381B2932